MPLPRPSSPRVLWADLRAFARERSRHQWIAAFFAIAMPVAIILAFVLDTRTNIMPGAQIIYADSWPANRSVEESVAQQKIDQEMREAQAAERQRQFQELENRLGI